MQNTIQSILFDVDGVLIQGQLFSIKLARELKLDKKEVAHFFNTDFQQALLGQKDLKKIIEPYLEKWGWQKSVEQFISYWRESENQPNQELLSLISQLHSKHIDCYIASNQEQYRGQYLFDDLEFGRLFDHCFFAYEIKAKKTDLKYWTYVWDSLQYLEGGIEKNQVLLIDNSLANINQAESFGFQGHLYENNADCITLLKTI
jgi:putative hydrolase of the HAD superfamily